MRYRNRFREKDVKYFWDSIADHYIHENDKVDETHDQRFIECMKHLKLKDGMKILNVWSRDGGLIPYLRKSGKKIELTNYELSPKLCSIARKLHPTETFIQGSLHEFPFEDNQFDAIISLETLEHVARPLRFLAECNRVIKDKGQLIMSLPPATAEYTSVAVNLLKFHHGEGPHRFLWPRTVKKMLRMSGFSLLRHKGTLFFYIGPKSLERYVPQSVNNIFGIRQFYISRADKKINPKQLGDLCTYCGTCFSEKNDVCPAKGFDYQRFNKEMFGKDASSFLGNFRNIYTGYSKNAKVRSEGASGGVVTQVLADLFDSKKIDHAVVVKFDKKTPCSPIPVIIDGKEELKESAQSKYTIVPVNSLIRKIRESRGRFAVVALPCQVHALRMLELDNIKYIIGLYCGNILSPDSTNSILRRFGVGPKQVKKMRFREGRWPGDFYIQTAKKDFRVNKFTWNHLIPFYINPGCLYCNDLSNEFADLSVGDGWHMSKSQSGLGRSIVVSRTARGEEMLRSSNLFLEKISEKKALLMHSHGYDLKKIGSQIRIENRKRQGKTFPYYNQKLLSISSKRRRKEYLNSLIFSLCRHAFARKAIELVPLSIIGRVFGYARTRWQKGTSHIVKN